MSATVILLVAIAAWVGTGIVLAMGLGRRGHDPLTWLVTAAMLGPLAALLGIWAVREEAVDPELVPTGLRQPSGAIPGSVSVLVGYDGSPASDAVVEEVIELFGARLGRLKIVSVVRFNPPRDDVTAAKAALVALADRIAFAAPEIEIAHGRPARALQQLATDEHFDVLAVGTAGARHLFASAAGELASHTSVPVLLAGRPNRAA